MDARTLNRTVALAFGAVYLLVGILGFAVTAGVDLAARDGELLLGVFEVNPLHNIVHLAIGAVLLAAGFAGTAAARAACTVVGIGYLVVGIVGMFMAGEQSANILAVNGADNALHLASAAVLLGTGVFSRHRVLDTARDAGDRRPAGANRS